MDKMYVKVPVSVKAKVTETLKSKIVSSLEAEVKQADLNAQQLEFRAKQALNEQANEDASKIELLQRQIDVEKAKLENAKNAILDKLKRAQKLELGAEIGHGKLERTVELKVGTNLDALMGAEILVEDGKIISFRD
jgi:hypothetical protein